VASDLLDELARLGGDAPRMDQFPELPLLDGVIKEGLRLFPPAPMNHRIAARDCELGGFEIARGSELLSSVYHTHRLPEFFADPNRFLPERWAALDPAPYLYSPFGGGPRTCIGASFAMMEMKVVLAMMLQRFRLELVPGARIDRTVNVTLASAHGMPMRVHAQDQRFDASARRVRGSVRQMVLLESE
jgi:cytochrome P450